MGCPVGIGPEIILRNALRQQQGATCRAAVVGDLGVLGRCAADLGLAVSLEPWTPGTPLPENALPVIECSRLAARKLRWGCPTAATAGAMAGYITRAVELAQQGVLAGIATCPISKAALQSAGIDHPGHTEMLAGLTGARDFAMMLAGSRLRVTLVTIHCPLAEVPRLLTVDKVARLIAITQRSLQRDFAIARPRIAVAGLNPHAGEGGLFGREEEQVIAPAIRQAQQQGIAAEGPFPPDTVYFKAAAGQYDTVVSMYHDQGLIPFKLLHFSDGVNVTLGLPIVRTSVDHGTAYDIAGKGIADCASLAAAVELAEVISRNRYHFDQRP